MIHIDRELHKLAIALELESQNLSVALACAGASSFVVLLMRSNPRDIIGELGAGATAHEAIESARRQTLDRREALARTYAERHGSPVGLPSLIRRKAK